MAYKPRKDIKVPESYIQKLRDTGSKKAALDKYGSSSDPKMREALRRFYGASAPAPMTDSKRATARTLPKKSIPMKTVAKAKPSGSADPRRAPSQNPRSAASAPKASSRTATKKSTSGKSVGQKLDTAARNVYKYAGPENFIAGGAALRAGRIAKSAAKAKSASKNARILETATGSKANLARTKVGYAKNMATKSEVKQAKAAVSKKRATGSKSVSDTSKRADDILKSTSKLPRKYKKTTAATAYGSYVVNQERKKKK
jgi:hypothetical protein